jgi:hypothetical protein
VEANACAGQYINHRHKPRDTESGAVAFEQVSKVENTTMTFTPKHPPSASMNEGEDHDKRSSNSSCNRLQLYLYAREYFHE